MVLFDYKLCLIIMCFFAMSVWQGLTGGNVTIEKGRVPAFWWVQRKKGEKKRERRRVGQD